MTDGLMSQTRAIDRIVEGLSPPRLTSLLIEVPPGCSRPKFRQLLEHRIQKIKPPKTLFSTLSVDTVRDDEGLYRQLVNDWCRDSAEAKDAWAAESHLTADLPPNKKLEFFSSCLGEGYRLIALINRFDKIFYKMSGEILASMRDLEMSNNLACINTSTLPYEALFKLRAKIDKDFSSDYGNSHPRISLTLIKNDEALDFWRENGLNVDSELKHAYFDIALEMSGRLPEAFLKAANLISDPDRMTPDLRWYRKELLEQMPSCFTRMIRYLSNNEELDVVRAIAALHTGLANDKQVTALRHNNWANILLSLDSATARLSCEASGRAALTFLRENSGGTDDEITPEELYKRKQYGACFRVCDQHSQYENTILKRCAYLGERLFTDSPQSLYFDDVSWKKISILAREIIKMCAEQKDKSHFEGLVLIAEAHKKRGNLDQPSIDRHLESVTTKGGRAIDEAVIHLGIRILAVSSDPATTCASQAGIPLPEELMRLYVTLVLGKKTDGTAFADITDEELSDWWRSSEEYSRPKPNTRLAATQLAILVAIGSKNRGLSMFESKEDFQRFLSKLDALRNRGAHYVVSAQKGDHDRWMEQIRQIYHRLVVDAELEWTLEKVKQMTSLPERVPLEIEKTERD